MHPSTPGSGLLGPAGPPLGFCWCGPATGTRAWRASRSLSQRAAPPCPRWVFAGAPGACRLTRSYCDRASRGLRVGLWCPTLETRQPREGSHPPSPAPGLCGHCRCHLGPRPTPGAAQKSRVKGHVHLKGDSGQTSPGGSGPARPAEGSRGRGLPRVRALGGTASPAPGGADAPGARRLLHAAPAAPPPGAAGCGASRLPGRPPPDLRHRSAAAGAPRPAPSRVSRRAASFLQRWQSPRAVRFVNRWFSAHPPCGRFAPLPGLAASWSSWGSQSPGSGSARPRAERAVAAPPARGGRTQAQCPGRAFPVLVFKKREVEKWLILFNFGGLVPALGGGCPQGAPRRSAGSPFAAPLGDPGVLGSPESPGRGGACFLWAVASAAGLPHPRVPAPRAGQRLRVAWGPGRAHHAPGPLIVS